MGRPAAVRAEVPAARKSPTADRHTTGSTVSTRMPDDLAAWYAERAQATGQSPHALRLAALTEYRDRHSLRPLGDYAKMPRRAGVAPAEAAE